MNGKWVLVLHKLINCGEMRKFNSVWFSLERKLLEILC
jgi:hypothetical protein